MKAVKEIKRLRLCNYHSDSMGWEHCSDNFSGCRVEQARKLNNRLFKYKKEFEWLKDKIKEIEKKLGRRP